MKINAYDIQLGDEIKDFLQSGRVVDFWTEHDDSPECSYITIRVFDKNNHMYDEIYGTKDTVNIVESMPQGAF
mgnify:CR=1 FL=1